MTYGYLGLFFVSFGSATFLPISSEIVFLSLLHTGYDSRICLLIVSIGNWLGGMFTYYLGWIGKTDWIIKYFKFDSDRIKKITTKLYSNKLSALGFFCFLPVVGDVIAFVLGMFRMSPLFVSIYMFSGKCFRYLLLFLGYKYGIELL